MRTYRLLKIKAQSKQQIVIQSSGVKQSTIENMVKMQKYAEEDRRRRNELKRLLLKESLTTQKPKMEEIQGPITCWWGATGRRISKMSSWLERQWNRREKTLDRQHLSRHHWSFRNGYKKMASWAGEGLEVWHWEQKADQKEENSNKEILSQKGHRSLGAVRLQAEMGKFSLLLCFAVFI